MPRGPRRATPNSVRRGGGEGINARSAGGGGRARTGHRPTDMFLYPPAALSRTDNWITTTHLCLLHSRAQIERLPNTPAYVKPAALMKRNTNKGTYIHTRSIRSIEMHARPAACTSDAKWRGIDRRAFLADRLHGAVEGQVPPAGAGARRRQQRLTRPLGYS